MADTGKKNRFTVERKKVVFSKGPIHLVDCLVKMRHGATLSRQIIEHPGAVVIIPKAANGRYILIKQFRFAAKDWLWEWPAGGIEKGESLKAAARRELMEETGFYPRRMQKLIHFYPTPGVSAEVMHLFLAENLTRRFRTPDADEEIEKRVFSLAEIGRMIRRGRIQDGKTIVGYFLLRSLSVGNRF